MAPAAPSDDGPPPTSGDLGAAIEREKLPGGRDEMAQPIPLRSTRERILVSMAESCAERGFAATRIADICGPAHVSRATFYELFADKEDCYYAAMELSLATAMERVVASYSADKPWSTQVRDAAAAFLDLLASRPAFARMALIEAPASGERAFELYASGKRVLQSLLDRGREDPIEEEAIPVSAGRAALCGAESLIAGQILAGNAERLRELLPDIVYITTVPYLGLDAALQQYREAEKLLSPPGG